MSYFSTYPEIKSVITQFGDFVQASIQLMSLTELSGGSDANHTEEIETQN